MTPPAAAAEREQIIPVRATPTQNRKELIRRQEHAEGAGHEAWTHGRNISDVNSTS